MNLWPDYCSKEVLAKRISLPATVIDQLVKRGLLPPPISIGEVKRWRWETIDLFLAARRPEDNIAVDPYLEPCGRRFSLMAQSAATTPNEIPFTPRMLATRW